MKLDITNKSTIVMPAAGRSESKKPRVLRDDGRKGGQSGRDGRGRPADSRGRAGGKKRG